MFLLLAAACGQRPQADLQYIKQARSIAAEWALVNEQANAGKLTPVYVRSMRSWLSEGLRTAFSSLSDPNSDYGKEIKALGTVPADAAPTALRHHADSLKRIEIKLESA
jgi:hypothetical protein